MKPEKKSILPGLSNISNTKKPLESLLKVKDDMSSSVLPIMAEFLKVKPYRRVIKQDGTIRQEVKPPSVKAREILKPGFSGNMFASYYVANKTFGWWDGSQTGLLDDYPSASAAYSVRALNSAYTGALLRVRRSSDNAEQDIHAIANGDFDTTSLLSFVGAANGFVVTWYDQSGNSENITQTLASSQPKIINAGSLVLSNSKVAIELGGTSTTSLIKILSTPITQPSTYLRVFENNGAIGSQRHFVEINDPSYVIGQTVSNVVTQYAGAFLSGTTTIINDSQYLHSGLFNTTSSQIRLNGASENTGNNGGLTSVTNLYIGGNTISNLFIGKAQEYIIYNSNNSTDLPAIESNINSYYSIYWDGSQTGLLDDYPSASAAYSVRALNSTYTGPLMRVRRSSDNAEQDIYAKYDGNLDTTSLLSFVGAANGFVVTWYDQSGNGDNATSAIAAEQPRIVVSGTLQTENSKPVIIGNTGTIRFNTSVDLSSTSPTQFSVSRHEGVVNATGYALSNFTDSDGNTNRTQLLSVNGSATSPYLTAPTSQFLNGSSFAFTTRDIAYDNLITQSLVSLNWTNPSFINLNYIGTSFTTLSMMSTQEFILYDADKLSDRADIESNINAYYSIF